MFLSGFVLYLFVVCIAIDGLSIEEQQQQQEKEEKEQEREEQEREGKLWVLVVKLSGGERKSGGLFRGEGEEAEKSE